MNAKLPCSTPSPQSISDALLGSAQLARLRMSVQDSKARFDAVRPAIPVAMLAHVKPGPVDTEGWSLLAANPSIAAKLRQLNPNLEALLRQAGWPVCTVRIKVVGS